MVDCPDWLTEIARRNIAELRATAAIAGSPTEPAPSLPVLGSPETDLLAVEMGREVLRKASQLLADRVSGVDSDRAPSPAATDVSR